MATDDTNSSQRQTQSRRRPIFSTRSAIEDAGRLAPSEVSPDAVRRSSTNPYEPTTAASRPSPRRHSRSIAFFDRIFQWPSGRNPVPELQHGEPALTNPVDVAGAAVEVGSDHKKDRSRRQDTGASTAAQSSKLGTFSGVFVPTSLNVISILMFLRFGFILGQSGVLGMMGEISRPHILVLQAHDN
jgi:solute carrier family 12 (potassium/chloride transporters), member 9